MSDPIMEQVWQVREQLLVEHGGMDGLLKHVKEMERERLRKVAEAKRRRNKTTAKTSRRKTKSTP